MNGHIEKNYVPQKVIEGQLLAALDDKAKVAIIADATDLCLLIAALERYVPHGGWCDNRRRLLTGLRELQASAFGATEAGGK